MVLDPLADIPIPAEIARLPKADIHIHAEWSPRLDRVLAKRHGRQPYDWRAWAGRLMTNEAPGGNRLRHLSKPFPELFEADKQADNFVARIVDIFEESAADGSILAEIRPGKDMAERPECFELIKVAAHKVQAQYPRFQAAAIPFIYIQWDEDKLEPLIKQYERWGKAGLIFGADLFNQPYDTEADWTQAYHIADRLASAGLGITVHVAEISPVNIPAVLKVPGLRRLGHATQAGYHPHLLEQVADSGLTVEVALSCNVILGAAPSYEAHPIRQFVAAGVPVTLCTDDPVQMSTTIGREYALAHHLGFGKDELLGFTRNAARVAFVSEETRQDLMLQLHAG